MTLPSLIDSKRDWWGSLEVKNVRGSRICQMRRFRHITSSRRIKIDNWVRRTELEMQANSDAARVHVEVQFELLHVMH